MVDLAEIVMGVFFPKVEVILILIRVPETLHWLLVFYKYIKVLDPGVEARVKFDCLLIHDYFRKKEGYYSKMKPGGGGIVC